MAGIVWNFLACILQVVNNEEHDAIEIHTPDRTYALVPESTVSYDFVKGSVSPQRVLGWKVPMYSFGEHRTGGILSSNSSEIFLEWHGSCLGAWSVERSIVSMKVTVAADGSGMLPDEVFLRVTPFEVAAMLEPDHCILAVPFTELTGWSTPVPSELRLLQVSSTLRQLFYRILNRYAIPLYISPYFIDTVQPQFLLHLLHRPSFANFVPPPPPTPL